MEHGSLAYISSKTPGTLLRNGIRESRKAVAHDIAVAARGSLSLASVLSLMERLRSSTSLIGCLQASTRRRQAREALFNSQVIPSGGSSAIASLISLMPQPGHTCPDVCERRPGGALWFLWEPLAEEGRKALQRRAGGTRFWREEGRFISFGNVGEWPFPLMRGGYLLLRPDSAIRIPSMGAASRTSAKLKSVPYIPAAASRGNIGTSRDGRHIRHRFGGQSCIIGHCSPSRRLFALEVAWQQIANGREVPGPSAGSGVLPAAATKAVPCQKSPLGKLLHWQISALAAPSGRCPARFPGRQRGAPLLCS